MKLEQWYPILQHFGNDAKSSFLNAVLNGENEDVVNSMCLIQDISSDTEFMLLFNAVFLLSHSCTGKDNAT